jgi:hypothetical protein
MYFSELSIVPETQTRYKSLFIRENRPLSVKSAGKSGSSIIGQPSNFGAWF